MVREAILVRWEGYLEGLASPISHKSSTDENTSFNATSELKS